MNTKAEKRHYHKVTQEQVEATRMYAEIGLSQTEIAKRVGLTSATISRIECKKLGLHTKATEPLSAEVQARIIRMYRDGDGRPAIAKTLDLPPHKVEGVLVRVRLRPQPGEPHCTYFVPAGIQTAVRREFREFEKQTAEKYGLSLAWLRRFLRRRK